MRCYSSLSHVKTSTLPFTLKIKNAEERKYKNGRRKWKWINDNVYEYGNNAQSDVALTCTMHTADTYYSQHSYD